MSRETVVNAGLSKPGTESIWAESPTALRIVSRTSGVRTKVVSPITSVGGGTIIASATVETEVPLPSASVARTM